MSKVITKYNGKPVSKEQLDQLMPPKENWLDGPSMTANTYTEHDPLISEGCGVHRTQVEETRTLIRQHGIQGAQVTPSGQIRFTSRRARKEFLQLRGLCDNDGGYGDS